MKSVDLTVRVPETVDLPISDRVSDAIRREEVLSWDIDRTTETLLFISVIVGDRTTVEAEAAAIEPITRFETTPIDEDSFYGYVEADLGEIDRSFVELSTVRRAQRRRSFGQPSRTSSMQLSISSELTA